MKGQTLHPFGMAAKKVSRETKLEAIALDATGKVTQDELATVLHINKRTFQRAKKNFREHGNVEGRPKKRGPKGKLHYDMKIVHLSQFFANGLNRPLSR
jgi:predicted transcriptional regulator